MENHNRFAAGPLFLALVAAGTAHGNKRVDGKEMVTRLCDAMEKKGVPGELVGVEMKSDDEHFDDERTLITGTVRRSVQTSGGPQVSCDYNGGIVVKHPVLTEAEARNLYLKKGMSTNAISGVYVKNGPAVSLVSR